MNINIKRVIKLFAPIGGTLLFMIYVSNHQTYLFFTSMGILLLCSYYLPVNQSSIPKEVAIYSTPIVIFYLALHVVFVPYLGLIIPLLLLVSFIGVSVRESKISKIWSVVFLTGVYSITYILVPLILKIELGSLLDNPAPKFELLNLDTNQTIRGDQYYDRVLVLSFFGTWCRPCIEELGALKEVEERLGTVNSKVKFAIVCTSQRGDSPEKAIEFREKREIPFDLLYDHSAALHYRFGFKPLPALAIIDREGNIRYKHVGFNKAENFVDTVLGIIHDLELEGRPTKNDFKK